jgi:phage terminase large subunit
MNNEELNRNLENYYFSLAYVYFKDMYGEPFKMSPWQQEIFRVIYEREILRAAIKTTTQYGKSEVASLALLSVAVERREKILIIAPSVKQAQIIMGKVIDHIFDHPFITGMVDFKTTGSLERLKEEKSKNRITFKNGSEIMLLTAIATNVQKEAKNLMGFGATIVLVDESSLIPDSMFSKILRMVGGVKHGKLIQLGNPFESNHFGKAFENKRYESISVNWEIALKEGRITQEFLDEAREDMTELDWTIFYETKFPEGGAADALIPRSWIEIAVGQRNCEGDYKQSGLDVARFGRDKTVYAFRKGGILFPLEQTEKMDIMEVSGWTVARLERDKPDRHCTDVIGLGAGAHDRIEEIQGQGFEDEDKDWSDCELIPVNVGEAPTDRDSKGKFHNLRAQVWWHLRNLFKPDEKGRSQISIPDDPELKKQLEEVRYKYSSERKIKIEAKDEMKKRLGISPDKADAVALAFWDYAEEAEPTLFIGAY